MPYPLDAALCKEPLCLQKTQWKMTNVFVHLINLSV
jgi:hypothetical protein